MYDVVIVGAGIVGTAIARELSRYSLKIAVIEKETEIGNGTTKANSGILHGGYDARPGTLKAQLNVRGNQLYEKLSKELDFEVKRIGSLVIAISEMDMKNLEMLYEQGIKNGVDRLEIISGERLRELEPNITHKALGALHSKGAGIISPFEAAFAFGENAAVNGVEFKLSTRVIKVYKDDEAFIVETDSGIYRSRFLVNASGVFSDDINNMLCEEKFNIVPRRGEYLLLDKCKGSLVNSVIFQCPTEKGKGVLVAPTVHGNLIVGPNAERIMDREDLATSREGMVEVFHSASRVVEGLSESDVITTFTGIRATPDTGDFVINVPVKGVVNAAGIESPGLTAAPAIGARVVELLEGEGLKLTAKKDFIPERIGFIRFLDLPAQRQSELIARNPAYGRIVCRCEGITEGEIIDAIRGPLGATTVDGVKHRVRAGAGRCQGGFCLPRVIEIISREMGIAPHEVLKCSHGSFILSGELREERTK